jgi:hypothetical protein
MNRIPRHTVERALSGADTSRAMARDVSDRELHLTDSATDKGCTGSARAHRGDTVAIRLRHTVTCIYAVEVISYRT